MKTCEITYHDLAGTIRVHDVDRTQSTDCRDGNPPFVAVHFHAGELDVQAYLEPDIARILHHQLGKLFPGDDLVGTFAGLFGMKLTVNSLDELKSRLDEPQPAGFPDASPEYRQAVEAMVRWFDAERDNLGTFHDKMDLCKYAEWAARKALGEDVGEFKGVPRLLIRPRQAEVDSAEPVQGI